MVIKPHNTGNIKIAEVISDQIIIQSAEDGLDLMGNIYYQGFDKVIVYEKNITPDFFDLKTKIAGEILQKFSNYRIALAIVGDFSKYESKSMKDFIFESNKTRHVNFVKTLEEALTNFSN
ncbi:MULTISPECIES: DUF4180 domain-containing protein [unclassified Chryseobacterium]|uniref:DUF4180 domain-containing protein n=1 Tax=unclassified Chryseobacterium TaxID=2593645 RepID=UPI00100A685B|nr:MULTISPECIES: DUF4180 domain-containing protein [unclassified Chryseobacterium]RXM50477.1 alpha/beta hydrolase [Chryseobacterium sp. CH25]RXM64618.1 alpha/beta hydrolase [Chryseobacterium sp. CH1]